MHLECTGCPQRKILTCLKKDDINVAMVQETHLDDSEHLKLQQGPFGQVFFSSFTTRSRGVAVLIRKNLSFIISDCVKDLKGRYVIIKGTLQGQNIVMMNVYFPPAQPTTFLTKMFLDLAPFLSNSTIIVGGDFNLNPLTDKFPHSAAPPSPQANTLHALCEEFGLIDAWRCTHPSDKEAPKTGETKIFRE